GLRADRIRQIVQDAIAEAAVELKAGSVELRSIAKEVISTVAEIIGSREKEAQEGISASVEGLIEGMSQHKREAIAEKQTQIQQLQSEVDHEEQKLEADINGALMEIETSAKQEPDHMRSVIENVVQSIKDREEFTSLMEQVAKLRTKLAVLDANLAARYGERYEEVKRHLDQAKVWYDTAKAKAEESGVDPVQQKQTEFETKMGEVGTAVARREKQIKQRLKELWQTATKL
ncbi:MAG TPA: histidine kinase, partial [Allocoleopsis sp.]